jgi:4-amino-4-deoxy-L-arabinose transferase-like glycosyltransferase
MKTIRFFLPVLLIFLSVFIRVFDLSHLPNGLYWDEQDVGYQAYSLLKTGRDYFGNLLPVFPHSLADYRTPILTYSTVPFVRFLGLTPLAVRLPVALYGLVSLAAFYLLVRFLFPRFRHAWLAILLLSVSPWHFTYSRLGFEMTCTLSFLLVSLVTFFRGLRRPAWLSVSALFFGLSLFSYSTAKFFIPLLLIALVFLFRREIFILPKKTLAVSLLILSLFAGVLGYDTLVGGSGMRFANLSLFSDPTLSSFIDRARQTHQSSLAGETRVGFVPGIWEKLSANKPLVVGHRLLVNYLQSFSSEFLFISGDPELRHSPGVDTMGQLSPALIIPLLLGLVALLNRRLVSRQLAIFLAVWLVFSPLPSAITHDGGNHASRLIFMLPALILLAYLGFISLFRINKLAFSVLLALFLFGSALDLDYYFSYYRQESARPFNWGYSQVINLALSLSSRYDRVYVDVGQNSPLMAYLFTTRFEPSVFQSLHPIKVVELAPEILAHQFGNIYLIQPGTRFWTNLIPDARFRGHNVIISDATQPLLLTNIEPLQKIMYPDGQPAFFVFAAKP